MTNRGFRLASLLVIREAVEQQQMRKVRACRSALDASAEALRHTDEWMKAAPGQYQSAELSGAELAFSKSCYDAVKNVRERYKDEHKLLAERFDREIESWRRAHRDVETIAVLKDQFSRALAFEIRRRDQESLDEDFRLCNERGNPRTDGEWLRLDGCNENGG